MGVVATIMNMKGGVGKTTVAIHLAGMAARFSLAGKPALNVLAIDYDPQFNMSQAFLEPAKYFKLEKDKKTILSVLLEQDTDLDPFTLQVPGTFEPPPLDSLKTEIYVGRRSGRLDLVPSTLNLMYVALGQANTQVKPIEERFHKFIQQCKAEYDLVLIDCHPAGSLFTKTSIRNSDHVIIPVAPQRYALRGIGLMMEFIGSKGIGKNAPTPHILFNLTSRIGTASLEDDIRANSKYSKYCLTNTLKRYSAFSEPENGLGFVWHSSKPWSTEAFNNLSKVSAELLTRIGV